MCEFLGFGCFLFPMADSYIYQRAGMEEHEKTQ